MKKYLFITLFMVVLAAFVFTGCGNSTDSDSESIALVIIVGRHANANMYTIDMLDNVRELIAKSIVETKSSTGYTAKAQVSVIISDGNPKVVTIDTDILNSKEVSNRANLNTEKIVDNVIAFLFSDDLRADDEEVDLLGAISEAQKILNADKTSEHHILILDTGITTAGYLDMRSYNLSEMECFDIIEAIRKGIPNLNPNNYKTYVTFWGLGNVAGKQSPLNDIELENKLVELWREIIVETAKGELTDDLCYSASMGEPMLYFETPTEDDPGYKYVSPVVFPTSTTLTIDRMPLNMWNKDFNVENEEPEKLGVEFLLDSQTLGFKPNSTLFRDNDQVTQVSNAINGQLTDYLNNTKNKIYVVGSIAKTAPDKSQKTDEISGGRAQAVADLLISLGAPEERIIVIDAGVTEFSWRNAVEFPDGFTCDPVAQQENRVVVIIGENSEKLDQLIEKGYVDARTHEAIAVE